MSVMDTALRESLKALRLSGRPIEPVTYGKVSGSASLPSSAFATPAPQAAYHWVLQPNRPAPVSRTRLPSLRESDLAVEERAAIEAARDTGRPLAERAFARGAARAIGWVLGFAPLDD
ncbi:hypothetical protein ACIRYZ_42775 [Kitasatospora sp. NPDC101155]|uniref:hypothetical protein n=1 Tax=Kitasatospora sp. NPDC101155 TaxID=3364097 RepID=UPI0037FE63C8